MTNRAAIACVGMNRHLHERVASSKQTEVGRIEWRGDWDSARDWSALRTPPLVYRAGYLFQEAARCRLPYSAAHLTRLCHGPRARTHDLTEGRK
jgi:hypothetical protein